mmetsp:Transcript_83572/g.259622  ORF Transcript_83572/g.259622 Transcript_83572/m.259622 type:complete len:210 (+) Transcript_83572:2461-3090(+)
MVSWSRRSAASMTACTPRTASSPTGASGAAARLTRLNATAAAPCCGRPPTVARSALGTWRRPPHAASLRLQSGPAPSAPGPRGDPARRAAAEACRRASGLSRTLRRMAAPCARASCRSCRCAMPSPAAPHPWNASWESGATGARVPAMPMAAARIGSVIARFSANPAVAARPAAAHSSSWRPATRRSTARSPTGRRGTLATRPAAAGSR